jgi:hypothetical protein
MRGSRWTSIVRTTGNWPKEPASNGALCTKVLFKNKAKRSLSNGLLIQVTDEKAIYLEKRPSKMPVICVRKLNCACNGARATTKRPEISAL